MKLFGFLLMIVFLIVSGNSIYISNDVIFDPINTDIIYKFEMNPTSSIFIGTNYITIDNNMLKITPNTGSLNGTIYDWDISGTKYKSFNITNISNVDNIDVSISGYDLSKNVKLYKDMILNSTLVSNSSGYAEFTHYGFSTINFTLYEDLTSPTITISSPTNSTYNTKTVWFNVTLDETGDWCGYSLDGATNVTMTNSSSNWNAQNTTMYDQYHEVVFSCNDTNGNMNSTTRGFTSQYENVTRCTTLDADYRTYYLRNSITDSSTSNCIDITANHITFDGLGHTIDGIDGVVTYGVHNSNYNNFTLKNCTFRDWYYGVGMINTTTFDFSDIESISCAKGCYFQGASYGNIIDSDFTYNSDGMGFYIYGVSQQTTDINITNINSSLNTWNGIRLSDSNNFIIKNSNSDSNSRNGIEISDSDNNIFYDCTFENNVRSGIETQSTNNNNKAYNNLFNNTDNFIINGALTTLYLNTTKQSGTRIYGAGNRIGGNYYTNSTGNGYSDTCTDANDAGFCDTEHTIGTGVVDYLPLTGNIALYLNNSRENRYYEYGDFVVNLSAKISPVENVWLDIDIVGYGINYTNSSTGYVSYNFETFTIEDEINYSGTMSTSHTFSGDGRTTKNFSWSLNEYDEVFGAKLNLTGDYNTSYAGNDAIDRPASVGNHFTFIDMNNNISMGGTITEFSVYGTFGGNFQLRIFRDNGTHYILIGNSSTKTISAGLNTYTESISVLDGDLVGYYVAAGMAIDANATGGSVRALNSDTGTSLKAIWGTGTKISSVSVTVEDFIYPSNITIDTNQDGMDKYYPLAELKGKNTFYLSSTSTDLDSTNLTFDTAGIKTFYLSFPADGFDYDRGTFNLTGHPFTVSQQSTLFDNITSNISVKTLNSNIWIYDINTTGIIQSGTTLRFPHNITIEGENVHPVKIYNITVTANKDSTVLVTGEKWGGNSSLRQNPDNSSEIEWTSHVTLPDNSVFRIVLGKNVTWNNEISHKEIAVNLTTTIPYAYMITESTSLQSGTHITRTDCSSTDECYFEDPSCSCNPSSPSCDFRYWDANYCDNNTATYAEMKGYPDDDNCICKETRARRYGYFTMTPTDINTIGYFKLKYKVYPRFSGNYHTDFYNTVSDYFERKYTWSFSLGYPDETWVYYDGVYVSSENYFDSNGFKFKNDMGNVHDSRLGYFIEPTMYFNRTVYNPSLEIDGSDVWDYTGRLYESDESNEISDYIETDNLFNFTSDGNYGELLIYFKPFWTSTPESITIRIGDETNDFYENTTVFNTSEEINITTEIEIKEYIIENCNDVTYCNIPFYISSKKAGIIEVSNINFTYSYDYIGLNPTLITSGTPVIDLTFYNGNITLDGLNVSYYGSKNITVTAHNDDYSYNASHNIMVVFSNFSIDYPHNTDYLLWSPYKSTLTNLQPFGQSKSTPAMKFTSLAYDQPFNIYMKAVNSLNCLTEFISTSYTGTKTEIVNNSYTNIIGMPIRSDTVNYNSTWAWMNLNSCTGGFFSPDILMYGKCTECV